MQAMIDELAKQAAESLGQVSGKETLASFWQEYLSKNGKIPALMKNLRTVAPEERPAMGKIINELKAKVQADYDAAAEQVKQAELAARNAAETVDITLPAKTRSVGGLHPLTLITNQIIDVFSGMGFSVGTFPEIEDDDHNFTRLNVPKDHPARDMQDTFYLSEEFLLRTQTSGGQIRTMDVQKPPIKILMPGRVFRSDSDATHSPNASTRWKVWWWIRASRWAIAGRSEHLRAEALRCRHPHPPASLLLPLHGAQRRGGRELLRVPRQGLPPCASTPAGSRCWAAASSTAKSSRTAASTRTSIPASPSASASSASPC